MEMQETKKRGDGVVPLGVAYNPHKAGLSSRNVDEVKRIVEEAARGGRFYENAEWKEAQLNRQIEKLCTCIAAAPKRSTAARAIVDEIESQRGGLDKVYVCVDFDAFYSAVAELDDPNLRGKPHAVGGGRNSVLSTSSYKARSFGVRSAMPLFVAKKLCPDLIVVPANPARYQELSNLATEKVFSKYAGGYFKSSSLDECIFEIGEYCARTGMSAEAVVEKMRAEVTAVTGGLTVSAGVACSRTIAKIAADFNKPNGSYFVPSSRVAVLEFCSGLNIRKIPGIGKVSESMLTRGFGIEKVGDIWDHLPALHFALSDSTFRFLVSNALGVAGSSDDYDAGSRQRKSVSRERTFRPLGDAAALREIVSGICSRVSEDIASLEGIDGGRVVTLKIKTSDFRVRSRSKTVWNVVSSKEDLQRIALEALEKELPLEARLLGVRVHDLAGSLYDAAKVNVNPGQARISSFFGNAGGKRFRVQNAGTEEEPLLRGEQDLLPDLDDDEIPPCPTSQRGQVSNRQARERDGGKEARMTCPVCGRATFDDLGCLNRHVDECLTEVELRGRSRKKRKKQYAMDAFFK